MSKKSRYLILAAGFLFFIIFAPLVVLYVTGYKYNTQTQSFTRTGILAVRSEPSSVTIALNDTVVKKSDGDLKFLNPGEYNLSISKEGYQSWSKRFMVQANFVTWANPAPQKLYLFKKPTPPQNLVNGAVSDFALTSDTLFYISSGYTSNSSSTLTIAPLNNLDRSENFVLPKFVNTINLSPRQDSLLLTNTQASTTALIVSIKNREITDLSSLFTGPVMVQFADDGSLYGQNLGTLYKINTNPLGKTVVATDTAAFDILNGDVYFLRPGSTSTSFMVLSRGSQQPQMLVTSIPNFNTGKIFINLQKQILILLDGTLYKISRTAQPLATNVIATNFVRADANLLLLHDGELDSYNYYTQNLDFITRTSLSLTNFFIRPDLGYSFFFRDTDATAVELDTRDQQNQYWFYKATKPQKLTLDQAGQNLYILDNGTLLSESIR